MKKIVWYKGGIDTKIEEGIYNDIRVEMRVNIFFNLANVQDLCCSGGRGRGVGEEGGSELHASCTLYLLYSWFPLSGSCLYLLCAISTTKYYVMVQICSQFLLVPVNRLWTWDLASSPLHIPLPIEPPSAVSYLIHVFLKLDPGGGSFRVKQIAFCKRGHVVLPHPPPPSQKKRNEK